MIPHQEMQERGLLETYSPDKEGKILFISHQWLSFHMPDPAGIHYEAIVAAVRSLATPNDPHSSV